MAGGQWVRWAASLMVGGACKEGGKEKGKSEVFQDVKVGGIPAVL